jgi:anaerobic selenocysteine-containing dehydrogenase
MTRTVVSYCRICPATCGLELEIAGTAGEARVTSVSGDEANPLSNGFTCTKGRHIADLVHAPQRIRGTRKRTADGRHEMISPAQAIDEIAARLQDIIAEHGPGAVGLFTGTQAAMSSLTLPFAQAFWRTVGSPKKFSTMTVDQSAKWVTEGRLGQWAAGGQRLAEADVWMFFGTNPLVSMQGGYFTGFPIHDGMRRLQRELRRGLRLVVVDPRRTELATRAEIHLQIVPGTDAALAAGLLRQLLEDGFADHAFAERWTNGLDGLRRAVAPFTPEAVSVVCGVPADDVVAAARLFGAATSGQATTGTGPDMGPHANLAEHLVQSLNVVCGRYPQPGDALAGVAVLGSAKPLPAQVIPPGRSWERDRSPITGYGPLYGEYPSPTLPEEILGDHPERLRALLVAGANPAIAVPDSARMRAALAELELLVTIDPYPSATAELADYVVGPVLHLERADTTRSYEGLMDRPFAQYTPAVLDPPEHTVDDWQFFLRLAGAMGATISVGGRQYAPGDPEPSTDEVLASFAGRAQVPLDEVRRHPHGAVFDGTAPPRAAPPVEGAGGRFDVTPNDVLGELAALGTALHEPPDGRLLLTVRRLKQVLNSTGTQIPSLVRGRPNPLFAHPEDLARLGLAADDVVEVRSDHGMVQATVTLDETLRTGTVNLSHGWGGPSPDGPPSGPNVNALLSSTSGLQAISAMPHMTAVPVTLTRVAVPTPTP